MRRKHPENKVAYLGCIGTLAASLFCCGLTTYLGLPRELDCYNPAHFGDRGTSQNIGPLEVGCLEMRLGLAREQVVHRFARLGPLTVNYDQTQSALVANLGLSVSTQSGDLHLGLRDGRPYWELYQPEPDPF